MGIGSGGHRCNGVRNKLLFFFSKTITIYKNSGSKRVKNGMGCYKVSLEASKSHKSIKAITELVSSTLRFSKAISSVFEKIRKCRVL
jgi:hypothetical protein